MGADIDMPLDDLPPPPAPAGPPPWTGQPVDWEDDGLDPALDRTTQVAVGPSLAAPVDAASAANVDRLAAAMAAAWPRIRAGAANWRGQRLAALAAPHVDAWMLDRLKDAAKTEQSVAAYEARRVQQATELADRRRTLKLQVRVPAVAIPVGLMLLWQFSGRWALTAAMSILAALALAAWRRGGRALAAPLAADPAAMDAPVAAATRPTLDAATIADALRDAGLLKQDQEISVTKVKPMFMGNGWSCWIKLPANVPARNVMAKRHEVATYLDTVDPCLILLPGTTSNRDLYMWLADRPPLSASPTTSPMANNTGTVDNWKGIPLGLTIHGEPLVVRLAGGPGWLIAGDPGMGKSFVARLLSLGVALDPHAQGIWMDPDSSGTWEPFGVIGEYLEGATHEALEAMVSRLEELADVELPRRRDALAAYRKANPMGVAESKVTGRIARDRRAGLPLLVVNVDEVHYLVGAAADPELKRRAIRALVKLATAGRKWGVVLVLQTQYASKENLPVEIRNVLQTRICLSVATEGAARVALGDIYDSTAMDPVALTSEEKGAFYMHGEGLISPAAPWVLARGDLVDDNEIPAMLERALELRKRRPELLPTGAVPVGDVLVRQLAPTDLEHLARLVAVFSDGEDTLRSAEIVERLQARYPGEYVGLTAHGMNGRLKPFGLRTEKVGRTGVAGLRLRTVEHAWIREQEKGAEQ